MGLTAAGNHLSLIAILLLCASLVAGSTLGIAPQDENYYASKTIKCRDGSRKFTRDRLNDEFCDCPDGTDEPGTSACPEGRFYCRNEGHSPSTVFSSRVNDGICDCCDGSDEYDGKVNCTNTCWEAGKIARERLQKKVTTYKEGVIIRTKEIVKAKAEFSRDEAELSKLKIEEKTLKGLVQKLKDKKEQIEKVEEQERLKREKEELILKEKENNVSEHEKQSEEPLNIDEEDIKSEEPDSFNRKATDNGDNLAGEDILNARHASTVDDEHLMDGNVEHDDSTVNFVTAKNEKEMDSSTESLSKEELGRAVASRWTGENVEHNKDGVEHNKDGVEHNRDDEDTIKEEYKSDLDSLESPEEEDYDGYNSETDDDNKNEDEKYGDDEFEDSSSNHKYRRDTYGGDDDYDAESEDRTESPDITTSGSSTWLDKIQHTVQNIFQKVNLFKAPVNASEAAHIRKEYDDARSKLSKIESKISRLTEKLKHDFGLDKEFYSFYDSCFEIKQNKYVYKVCPFKQASQIEGHSTTRLGHWKGFEEAYRVMQFLDGDKCWNGPDRSLKVRLRCGLQTEITDVDEPSRCEYSAFLSTPMVCIEEKLKELQVKLASTNARQPLMHEEL